MANDSKLRQLYGDEKGVAMAIVVMGMLAIILMTVMIQSLATSQLNQADYFKREDTVLAGTEAMLERYATKLSIDPLYYQRYVDEAEAPRVCSDTTSTGYNTTVLPGNNWISTCATWDYVETTNFYAHPLLAGDASTTEDDIAVLLRVTPPTDGKQVEVTVVGRQAGRLNPRVVTSEIRATAISEFVRMVENDLRYGGGAKTFGKVYVGGNIGYRTGGEAYADVYAENSIGFYSYGEWYGPPTWKNGAEGYDSTGNNNAAGEYVTDYYPDPIDFDRFWDDLGLLERAACDGGGLCLDPAYNSSIPTGVDAYLIESVNTTGQPTRLKISYATSPPSANYCDGAESSWTKYSQNASWTYLGTFDLPVNGAVWANEHIVIGRNSTTPFVMNGIVSFYAGNSSSRRNVIIASDITYGSALTGNDIVGLIGSDEVWINPTSVGTDRELNIYAAILNQNGQLKAATACNGSRINLSNSELNMYGSNASLGTGNMSCCFTPRNYNFDPRLDRLRPPFFPLLSDEWTYTNWRETPTPCWAKPGGC
ncbi:hypothetical protein MNBD_ACTINO02-3082 [hydrothermal vent metagenome]|uniref:Type 4 fimbrial biogenesis protein PilX N-terminal domain-containing protein n=1 Tax=hydrothermal vent metagenome TaxID=652676 RepID=A0A3B0SAE7_9ZZZZ